MRPIVITLPAIIYCLFFITGNAIASNQADPYLMKVSSSGKNRNNRIVTKIPKAAKERDLALIHQFMDLILQGNEPEARILATDGSNDDTGQHKNYSSEKIARLKIFGNPKARVDAVYYFQDVITQFKHLRYYFVIYETKQHLYPEVMKIELINFDNLFYLNRFWAPR